VLRAEKSLPGHVARGSVTTRRNTEVVHIKSRHLDSDATIVADSTELLSVKHTRQVDIELVSEREHCRISHGEHDR
jgi:hypothetical protein